jgi:hypothetical protein
MEKVEQASVQQFVGEERVVKASILLFISVLGR